MTGAPRTAAEAIARARDLLAPEDEHLSARLDDVERGTSVAQLEDVLAWLTRSIASGGRPRPLEYRKLAAVQAAARARLAELAQQDAEPAPVESPAPVPIPTLSTGVAPPPWWRRLFRA